MSGARYRGCARKTIASNMKVNEVIANLALDSLGHKKGEYQYVNSNDHASFGGPRTMSIRWPSTSG